MHFFFPGKLEPYDLNHQMTFNKIFSLCAVDPYCSSKLTFAAPQVMSRVLDLFKSGFCSAAIPPNVTMDDVLQVMRYSLTPTAGRIFLAPLVYRIARCNLNDVKFLRDIISSLKQGYDVLRNSKEPLTGYNWVGKPLRIKTELF